MQYEGNNAQDDSPGGAIPFDLSTVDNRKLHMPKNHKITSAVEQSDASAVTSEGSIGSG